MWMVDVEDWEPEHGREPMKVSYSKGIPQSLRQLAHLAPMNDPEMLESIFRLHGNEIAALLIEPIQGICCAISATKEYVEKARELCDLYGTLLIIDEVKTGFRVARGGVQELMGVRADISTFAKAMGNGYPISAIGGREDVMRTFNFGGAAHGGTYTAHSVSIAAAAETLRILDETDTLEQIAAYGKTLMDGISKILTARGVVHSFTGHPSMFGLFFAETAPDNYRDWKNSDYTFYDTMAQHLHDAGVIVEPDSREPWFMCAAHDPSCLKDTLRAVEWAVEMTLEELAVA
jgi:glutamate-1-semialdehyde 2,1-aminomutase